MNVYVQCNRMTFVLSRSVLRFTAEFITLYEEVHNGIGKRIDAKPLKLDKKFIIVL